jgi:hypothetical protein
MDLKRAWTLCAANRSLRFLIPMAVLLLISVGWNIWNYQLHRKQHADAVHADAAKEEHASKIASALTTDQTKLAESKRRARDAKTDTRVQQLYDEINQLTKLSEQVLLHDQANRASAAAKSSEDHAVRVR